MDKAPLYKLNVYSFLTPVFGLYFGYAYFSETLSPVQWLGILLIIGAIPMVTSLSRKPEA
ncbi:MAG TPA: EamA/RhaT family transporter, partial [Gemmatimonadetes bacterium]|nr:EamA/RhaT family transporter [Gemmatimonadota bacterium]